MRTHKKLTLLPYSFKEPLDLQTYFKLYPFLIKGALRTCYEHFMTVIVFPWHLMSYIVNCYATVDPDCTGDTAMMERKDCGICQYCLIFMIGCDSSLG
jgi:hypothetical protein